MTPRTITTSPPILECGMCARTLLRGERLERLVSAGEYIEVCELCTPRALSEGWRRLAPLEQPPPPPRARRGRGLLERLRGAPSSPSAADPDEPMRGAAPSPAPSPSPAPAPVPAPVVEQVASEPAPVPSLEQELQLLALPQQGEKLIQGAVLLFNGSEFPRRLAALARSLGPPAVHVSVSRERPSVVAIVVAWELCWYRYEVDLSEEGAAVRVAAQGSELFELAPAERLANALCGPSGEISI